MKHTIICFFILLSSIVYGKDNSNLDEIKKLIIDIENRYIQNLDYYERRDAIKQMDLLSEKISEIQQESREKQPVVFLNKDDFNNFLKRVNLNYKNENTKIKFYKENRDRYIFNVRQLSLILETIKNESSKISLLKILYESIMDKYSCELLISNFKSDKNREIVIDFFQSKGISLEEEIESESKVEKIVGMDDKLFSTLFQQYRSTASFDSDKNTFIEGIVTYNHFSALQAAKLLELFSFDDQRLIAFKNLLPTVEDQESIFILVETFTFNSGKDSALKILAEAGSGNNTEFINDKLFTNVLNNYKNKARYDNERHLFIDEVIGNHLLSTDQAMQFLLEFGSDQQRLSALRKILPKIVDPGLAYKLVNSFSFEAGKSSAMKLINQYNSKV